MIKIKRGEINNVYLTLWEDSLDKCNDNFYLFDIKSKNNNNFKSIVMEDISSLEERFRYNIFEFDLVDNDDLIEIFDLEGTYTFNVYEYDLIEETRLNLIESGLFYVVGDKNFKENKQSVEYYVFNKE
jgi:hypothetical protein